MSDSRARRLRHVGEKAIREALARGGSIALALVLEGERSAAVTSLVETLGSGGTSILSESAREMRRMTEEAGDASQVPEIIAFEGALPTSDLDTLMSAPGLALVLVGLRYPANVGFIMRSAEVAGAAGIVLAHDWCAGEREEASRISIRADRFLPVLDTPGAAGAEAALEAARRQGRCIVAAETTGDETPWSLDWARPTAVFLGSETTGLPETILAAADARVRIPTLGFIPSYNVQAATGILLGEYLRQTTR